MEVGLFSDVKPEASGIGIRVTSKAAEEGLAHQVSFGWRLRQDISIGGTGYLGEVAVWYKNGVKC